MYQDSLLQSVILNILWILTLLVCVWVLYAIVYAIFMFVFSGWNEEKIKKAWASIRYALLWFILTLIILFAVPWFLRAIHVPWYNKYTSANVFANSKMWLNKIIWVFNSKQANPYGLGTDDGWDYSL